MSADSSSETVSKEVEKEWEPSDMKFPACGSLHEQYVVCIKPRYQYSHARRHGVAAPCMDMFFNWKDCLYASIATKPGAKEEIYKESRIYKNYLEKTKNEVFDYKVTPSWND